METRDKVIVCIVGAFCFIMGFLWYSCFRTNYTIVDMSDYNKRK